MKKNGTMFPKAFIPRGHVFRDVLCCKLSRFSSSVFIRSNLHKAEMDLSWYSYSFI